MERKYISFEESREIMLRLMDLIDKVCRENNLKYYMSGGTLLGAVRHKGFIPWDDDVDIVLFRKDYDAFLEIMKTLPPENHIEVMDIDTYGYYNTYSKICDNRTVVQEGYRKENENRPYGIWIDVFPYENYPDGKESKRKRFMSNCQWLRVTMSAMQTNFRNEKFGLKFIVRYFLNIAAHILGRKRVLMFSHKYSTKYKDDNTSYVGCTFTPYKREYFEKSIYEECVDIPFEGRMYMGTKSWDFVLRRMYGDNYMELPPIEKRHTHRVVAWWK